MLCWGSTWYTDLIHHSALQWSWKGGPSYKKGWIFRTNLNRPWPPLFNFLFFWDLRLQYDKFKQGSPSQATPRNKNVSENLYKPDKSQEVRIGFIIIFNVPEKTITNKLRNLGRCNSSGQLWAGLIPLMLWLLTALAARYFTPPGDFHPSIQSIHPLIAYFLFVWGQIDTSFKVSSSRVPTSMLKMGVKIITKKKRRK